MKTNQLPLSRQFLLGQKGSVFLQAMIAIAVTAAALYFLAPRIIDYRKQAVRNSNLISARLAVHSVLDYTLVGIKQKWCFSAAWTPEPCGASATQIALHPRSVDRILMTEESVNYLKLLGVPNWSQAKIDKIEYVLAVSDITTSNPVYKIFQKMDSRVQKIKIIIAVDNSATLPRYGDEVYLRVDVSLLNSSGEVVTIGSSKLTATSYVGVYPREVGSFALILANNLYLDRASLSSAGKGDAFFKNFSSKSAALSKGGLVFNSPVFVNNDIYLPSSTATGTYTPVTFKEKVYVGAGLLRRDGKGFVPQLSGGTGSSYWSDITQFGGFEGGVEVDGKKDLGLEFLSGARTASSTIDSEKLKKCIANTAANSLLGATNNSLLLGDLASNNNNQYSYRLKLTDYNKFTAQSGTLPPVTSTKSGSAGLGLLDSKYTQSSNGASLGYKLKIGGLTVSGVIPENGSTILKTESNVQPLIDLYTNSINQNNQAIAQDQNKISQLKSDIENMQAQLSSIKDSIDAEKQKNSPQSTISALEDKYDNLKNDIRNKKNLLESYKNDLQNLESKSASLEKSLDDAKSMNKQQATLTLSLDRYIGRTGDFGTINGSYRELTLKTQNPEWLINESGKKLDVTLELEAFDVSYTAFTSYRDSVVLARELNKGRVDLKWINGRLVSANGLRDMYGADKLSAGAVDLYVNYDEVCKTVDYSSFATVGWESSFADVSNLSWSFTNSYESRTNYVFNNTNASTAGGAVPAFVIKSIVRDCIIESTANFVAGFLNCEHLTIKARTNPLTIVGTFIVTNGMTIDDSAYVAGIRWQSIFHPEATYLLRNAGVLKAAGGGSCNNLSRTPIWHPRPALIDRINAQQCNAMALRLRADPFRWTSVDPDCGLISSSSTATVCKNSLGNYYTLEVYRESGI
ncbi:MAG: hypothetical protein ACM3MG_01975 [Bacillota bacterium]